MVVSYFILLPVKLQVQSGVYHEVAELLASGLKIYISDIHILFQNLPLVGKLCRIKYLLFIFIKSLFQVKTDTGYE